MTSWDTCDLNADNLYRRDFVLKQPSTVGPWVALGLGVTLVAFLSYLVYANVFLPSPPPPLTPETTLRPKATPSAPTSSLKRAPRHAPEWHTPALPVGPQGRAPHALFGGQGPALLPEPPMPPEASLSPPVATQASVRR